MSCVQAMSVCMQAALCGWRRWWAQRAMRASAIAAPCSETLTLPRHTPTNLQRWALHACRQPWVLGVVACCTAAAAQPAVGAPPLAGIDGGCKLAGGSARHCSACVRLRLRHCRGGVALAGAAAALQRKLGGRVRKW